MSIKALTFDVFGTVVDWRNSIIEQFQTFGREKGIALDWNAFVDDWKTCYRPGMNAVNKQRLSCTNVDGIYRVKLDALLGEYGITGLTETEKIRFNRTWHRCKPSPDGVAGLTGLKTKYVLSTLSNGDVACLVNMAKYGAITLGLHTVRRAFPPQYPALKQQIARLGDLERHLIIWKGKYEGVFLSSPFMSLCYVGVRENVPFPSGIEDELRSYLNSHLTKTP